MIGFVVVPLRMQYMDVLRPGALAGFVVALVRAGAVDADLIRRGALLKAPVLKLVSARLSPCLAAEGA
jgi:hypothetical protein